MVSNEEQEEKREIKKRYIILAVGLIATVFVMWYFKTPRNGETEIKQEISQIEEEHEEITDLAEKVIEDLDYKESKLDSLEHVLTDSDSLSKEEIKKLEDQISKEKALIEYYKNKSEVVELVEYTETVDVDSLYETISHLEDVIKNTNIELENAYEKISILEEQIEKLLEEPVIVPTMGMGPENFIDTISVDTNDVDKKKDKKKKGKKKKKD